MKPSLLIRISSAAAQHRRIVALLWIALAVVGALSVGSVGPRLQSRFDTPGQPGYEANLAMVKSVGIDGNEEPVLAVLHLPPGQTMATADGQATAARTFAGARKAGVLAVADYAGTRNPKLITDGGRSTWALIDMPNPDVGPGVGVADKVGAALQAAAPAGAKVVLTGYGALKDKSSGGGGPSILTETLIGGIGALVVLALIYGSAVAVIPLLMAIPSILVTFLCVLGMTYLGEVSSLVQYLVALVGLGVSVDYSLFIVTRWREERERGLSNQDAIAAASDSAGRAVLLSGATVALGLLSLVVLPVPFLRSIGIGGMLIPLVATAASLTLLPATLAAFGPALDKRRIWRGSTTHSRMWDRWARAVVRRRWIAGLAGLAVVVGLAIPAFSMNTATPSIASLPGKGAPLTAFQGLRAAGVPNGIDFPVQLLVHGGAANATRAAAIAEATPGVYTVLAPRTDQFVRGGDSLITVIPHDEGTTKAGKDTVTALRQRLGGIPGGVQIGGAVPAEMDFNHVVYGNFPLLLGLLALITFVVLTRAFRSPVLAAKAVVLNLISLGTAYGFMVWFWQSGHGSDLIFGIPATSAIRDWPPVVVFAFLFGLSMDYEVFVLSRMREEYDAAGSTETAVVNGLARTGRLVTGAAAILAISFLSLAITGNIFIQITASALAFGIVLDAVLIRTVLVPAFVALMGRWNWWVPRWLAR